jgi:hypothetical protein
LELRKAEISGTQQLEAARLGVDIEKDKAALAVKQQIEGVRIGLDISKSKEDADMRRAQMQKSQESEGSVE